MSNSYFNHNVQRFSIRKYSLGAASVLLGVFLFSAAHTASADEVNIETASSQVVEVSKNESIEAPVTQTVGDSTASRSINVQSDVQEKSEVTSIESFPVKEDTVTVSETPSEQAQEVTTSDSDSKQKIVSNQGQEDSKEDSKLPHAGVVESLVEDKINVEPVKEESKEQGSEIEKKNETPSTTGYSTFFNMGTFRRASDNPRIGDDYPAYWRNNPNQWDSWGYATGNCTSFVANRLHQVNKFDDLRGLGNGGEWGANARRKGYRVDSTPTRGSVAYFNDGLYGHVAWVADVQGDKVIIEEYNWYRNGIYDHSYHTQTLPISSYTGYIHFKDLTGGNTGGTPQPTNNTGSSLPSSPLPVVPLSRLSLSFLALS